MNFFQHQDEARRSTGRLVLLFFIAVSVLLIITNVVIISGLWFLDTSTFQKSGTHLDDIKSLKQLREYFNLKHIAIISFINLAIIGLEIAVKRGNLSKGGKVIAHYLGGQKIDHFSNNHNEQIILNIVEEMAIASGTSVPPVYILPESGINAFAAGLNPSDAIIGLSRGAIEQLDRDQLQGVVAHEFSHIYNGDMRLNINLIAVLSGIEFIGHAGWFFVRLFSVSSVAHHRRHRRNPWNAIATIAGFALIFIGYLGVFFGSLIKSAVSRQREFLADASAVQFTRNPEGIADALKIIGGSQHGSIINSERTNELSHLFFSNALQKKFSLPFASFFSTHPPLKERIRRIDPRWDGSFLSSTSIRRKNSTINQNNQQESNTGKTDVDRAKVLNTVGSVMGAAAIVSTPSQISMHVTEKELLSNLSEAVDYIGNTDESSIKKAQHLLSIIPKSIKRASYSVDSSKALLYLMLLDKQSNIRTEQEAYINTKENNKVVKYIKELESDFLKCSESQRINILELSIPALKNMTEEEYKKFKIGLVFLIKADKKIDIFEWLLYQLSIHYLQPNFETSKSTKPVYRSLKKLRNECKFLLSYLSYAGQETNPNGYQNVFSKGFETLGLGRTNIVPSSQLRIKDLNNAVHHFSQLYPLVKPRLLKACAECIQADNVISVTQLDLLRAMSALLDCPMPLLEITDGINISSKI